MFKRTPPREDLFAQAPVQGHARIRVGIGGWTFAPWRGLFYPQGLTQRRELEYASRRVTAIEINGTFYSPQKPEIYARWREETPEGFVFSLKAPKYITHSRSLARVRPAAEEFIGGVLHLGDRLGPLLWQFPPSKHFDAEELEGFAEQLPRHADGRALHHVFEVRHPSFLVPEYVALARRQKVATVFTDSPDYPSMADVTADFVYTRLMRSRTEIVQGYPSEELDAWAQRLQQWADGGEPGDLPRVAAALAGTGGPREVFVYFISAAKHRNPAAAQALLERLR